MYFPVDKWFYLSYPAGPSLFRILSEIDIFYGGVAEWLKAADCKSARVAYVGSNPTPTTIAEKIKRICAGKRWQAATVSG